MDALRAHFGPLPAVLAGFSFGGFVASRLAARADAAGDPFALVVLVAPAVGRFEVGPVSPSTVVIHGEDDDGVGRRLHRVGSLVGLPGEPELAAEDGLPPLLRRVVLEFQSAAEVRRFRQVVGLPALLSPPVGQLVRLGAVMHH